MKHTVEKTRNLIFLILGLLLGSFLGTMLTVVFVWRALTN